MPPPQDLTTVDIDIMIGYKRALSCLKQKLQYRYVRFVHKYACSSAAGGLKMVAIGLVPDLTVEAAKRAALGAGARVMGVFGYELSKCEIKEITQSAPDIILLAGGTDGGNKQCIVHNAEQIALHFPDTPVVVAGNKTVVSEIERIMEAHNMCYRITQNVMPSLNVLNVEPAREAIRDIFMEKIVEAKGIHVAKSTIDGVLMPTPAAVLEAARLLADGTDLEEGIGPLLILDIGGATTDVYSIGSGEPTKPDVLQVGLEEPYAKRTVEGDLGMRVSAVSLWEAAGTRRIRNHAPHLNLDIEARCRYLQLQVETVSQTQEEIDFDEALGRVAAELAVERHSGVLENVYTPMGMITSQTGKDLLEIRTVIGTGGVLVHSHNPKRIVQAGLFSLENPTSLKPEKSQIIVDRRYILSAMGLLAVYHPDKALRIMKKHLV